MMKKGENPTFLSQTPNKDEIYSLAIGRFDGLHLGHGAIFEHLGERSAVLIIENHHANLTPNRAKFAKIPLFFYEFKEIRALCVEDFIAKLRADFANLKQIVVGADFRFGRDRSGGVDELRASFGGEVCVVDEYKISGVAVHSAKIREFLSAGEIEKANKFLGRNYEICGQIVRGVGLGKRELFATINADTNGYFLPKNGVYATFVRILGVSVFIPARKNFDDKSGENLDKFSQISGDNFGWFWGATFIGNRLSVDGKFAIETHVLADENGRKIDADFWQNLGDIVGLNLEIRFVKFIRENIKFSDLSALKAQISRDFDEIKAVLQSKKC
jgi:riboflavin biosynthesis protein ribF